MASLLPQETDVTYVEPFCGMCGILFQRPKSILEIINDLNSRIANWFQVIRDDAEEIAHHVHYTPLVEDDFKYAKENLDNPNISKVKRAWCFYVVVNFSMMHGDERINIAKLWTPSGGVNRLKHENILAISERLLDVQILNMDAVDMLERVVDIEKTVIYCDPPYPSSETSPYLHSDIDQDRLIDVLKQCKGKVAISGYRDEWDGLGWQRQELKSSRNTWKGVGAGLEHSDRTEILWTNYEPAQGMLL